MLARARLISAYSCDVSAGAILKDALLLPHPVGIVIGKGVRISGPVTIYQGVTLGSGAGAYPELHGENKIFPNSIVVGGIKLKERSIVGAGSFVNRDLDVGQVVLGRSCQ